MDKRLYFTGTITDRSAEEGDDGEHGWWDPHWSTFVLWDDKGDVTFEVYVPDPEDDEDETPAQWLARTITQHMGAVEADSSHGTPRWFTACSPIEDYSTGKDLIPSAHPEGFTDAEMVEAYQIMRG